MPVGPGAGAGLVWSTGALLIASALLLLSPDALRPKGAWVLAAAVLMETAGIYVLSPRAEWFDADDLQRHSPFLKVAGPPSDDRWSIALEDDFKTHANPDYVASTGRC